MSAIFLNVLTEKIEICPRREGSIYLLLSWGRCPTTSTLIIASKLSFPNLTYGQAQKERCTKGTNNEDTIYSLIDLCLRVAYGARIMRSDFHQGMSLFLDIPFCRSSLLRGLNPAREKANAH